MSPTLLDLPDELLICISEQLIDTKLALQNLVLANRRLSAIAEPALYRSVFFRKPSELARLIGVIKDSPRRMNGIHHLDVRAQRLVVLATP